MESIVVQLLVQGGALGLAFLMLVWLATSHLPRLMAQHRQDLRDLREGYETSLRTQRHDFRNTMQEMTSTHAAAMKDQHDSFTAELREQRESNVEEHKATRENITKLAAAIDGLQQRLMKGP